MRSFETKPNFIPHNDDGRRESLSVQKGATLENMLVTNGISVESSEHKEGDSVVHARIEPGTYFVSAGFPDTDLSDKHFLYANNPHERREQPFKLDPNAPEFLRLEQEFSARLNPETGVLDQVEVLNEVIQENIRSDYADEDVQTTTDIIKSGQSVCVGKSLIAAMILKKLKPHLKVEHLQGASSQTEDENIAAHEFGHHWLRIEDIGARIVVLYDPFYNNIRSYSLDNAQVSNNDPFQKYDVYAYHMGRFSSMVGMVDFEGLKIIEVPRPRKNKTDRILCISSDESIVAQVFGEMRAGVLVNGGTAEFINGGIAVTMNPNEIHAAARYINPINEVRKLED